MADYFDSSVFVAAVSEDDPDHESSGRAWDSAIDPVFYARGLLESFATLTGKRHPTCLAPDEAAAVISGTLENTAVEIIQFTPLEIITLLQKARRHGVRGGAIYDHLHLCAARKAGVDRIFTLNKRHFTAIAPDLAPRIFHPEELF